MKETPKEKIIQKNLESGKFSLKGFLGTDRRRYTQIIEEDKKMLQKLNLTQEKVAMRLKYFTDLAFEHYEGKTIIDDIFEVEYKTFRGKIICPFKHSGIFDKGIVTLKNLENEKTISWTPLNIHLIEKHCFFEGLESQNRISPKNIKQIIFKKGDLNDQREI